MHLYTPIILSKAGEFSALSELEHLDKIKTIPLIQALPDTAEKRKKGYVNSRVKPLIKSWSFLDNRIYLDFHYLGPAVTSLHHEFYDKLKAGLINCIPVISPSANQELFEFVKERSLLGVCLRIPSSAMEVTTINRRISDIVKNAGLDYNEIDLLLDFGQISQEHINSYLNSFAHIYPQIENKEKLRKIIVASGSYPSSNDKFSKGNIYDLNRAEWAVWRTLREKYTGIIYSDYGSVSAVFDPYAKTYEGACSIKYTTADRYILFRGEKASDSPIGNEQYQIKASELIQKPYYEGPNFSWGDNFIMECANAMVTPGNSTSWVKVSQNHHFVKILRLLAE